MLFWIHLISSVIAGLLIIYLSISCRLKKKYHKELSIIMALSGIVSLISACLYGFTLEFSFNLVNIHNWIGMTSLILSLLPFIRYLTRTSEWHYLIGDLAAVFATVSIITGFIAYGWVFIPESTQCFTLSELQEAEHCLVAVDGVIYDMTSMPRWGTGNHFDYECGGSYNMSSLPSSHQADKYYGPIVGRLC